MTRSLNHMCYTWWPLRFVPLPQSMCWQFALTGTAQEQCLCQWTHKHTHRPQHHPKAWLNGTFTYMWFIFQSNKNLIFVVRGLMWVLYVLCLCCACAVLLIDLELHYFNITYYIIECIIKLIYFVMKSSKWILSLSDVVIVVHWHTIM